MKTLSINQLHLEILGCRKCGLCKTRIHAVPGQGPSNARILFIGEAPGKKKDEKGFPFVGKAGKFLDELLASIHLQREDIFITNIVKCRPPSNRDPLPEEILNCGPYLDKQIHEIQPKVICPLGRFSAQYVLEKFGFEWTSITQVAGQKFSRSIFPKGTGRICQVTIVPLFHPCVAIYDGKKKPLLVEHFKQLKNILEG